MDSGSALSFINGDMFDKLCLAFPKMTISNVARTCTLANASPTNISQTVQLTVHFHEFSWKQEFWVFPDLTFQTVLGTDFM